MFRDDFVGPQSGFVAGLTAGYARFGRTFRLIAG